MSAGNPPKPGGGGSDKRRWPRIAVNLAVSVKFATAQDVLSSRTIDISRGGAFIQMAVPRAEGTKITMHMSIGADSVALTGVVVRSVRPEELAGPPGIGVVFTDLDDRSRKMIDDLVAQKLAKTQGR